MFKFFLGIVLLIIAIVLAMTGAGIILAIPFGLIGLFLVIWGFTAMMGGGAKRAASAFKSNDERS